MHSSTPDLKSLPLNRAVYEYFSPDRLEELKNRTLHILDKVGVRFPSPRALEIFAAHGARVDMDKQLVRLPAELVHKALASVPSDLVLGGREERFDLHLDGRTAYTSTIGTATNVVDLHTRQKRPSTKQDLAFITRVSDALPMVNMAWSVVTAQEYGPSAPVHDCHALLTNTLKHVRGARGMFPRLAPYVVEMASAVAGGQEALRARPPISATITSLTPLAYDHHSIDCALIFAQAGLPVMFVAKPILCSTAPASVLGAIALGDAEVISGIVLSQLAFPGTPVMHILWLDQMHPMTAECLYYNPLPWNVITVQLAKAWGLPCGGGSFMESGASATNWRAGASSGFGAAIIPLCGAQLTGFFGLLGGMVFTPEQLFLDHECLLEAHSFFSDMGDVPADIPLELIEKVGHGGHYLRQMHTVQHIRDFRLSPLIRQKNPDATFRPPQEVALEEMRKLDREHQPQPLEAGLADELEKIVKAADAEAEGIK